MTPAARNIEHALLWSFVLFAFSATFSIAISQLFLGLSLVICIVLLVVACDHPFPRPLRLFWWAVAIWVAWWFLTALLGDTPLRSLRLSREEWLFSAVLTGTVVLRTESRRRLVLRALALGVVVVGLYGLVQYITGYHLIERHTVHPAPGFGWRVLGFFNNYMTFGNFYAVAAVFLGAFTLLRFRALARPDRLLMPAASLLAILMTLLSFGRGAIAAMLGTVLLMLLLLGKKYARLSLAVIGVMIVLLVAIPGVADRYLGSLERDFGGEYAGGRMFVWKHSVEVIQDHPVFGVGMGNFKEAYAAKLPPETPAFRRYTHAHNDALNVAAIAGIPGLLVFVALWLTALGYFWVGYRRRRELSDEPMAIFFAALAGSICFAATSLTEATFVDEEVRALLMLIWACGLVGWYKGHTGERIEGSGQST